MALRIDILTLFPEMFEGPGPLSSSMIGRARAAGQVDIRIRNIRDWTHDRHRVADDTPYGGGAGMVMKPEPLVEAIETVRREGGAGNSRSKVVYLTPAGELFNQAVARRFAQLDHLILICGHYEGIDERVRDLAIDEEVSIGDYVLTGGELPAMVVTDAVVRLLPGVLGNPDSARQESFMDHILDYPVYTRPEEFRGVRVPAVLLSGHHAQIQRWRRKMALKRTAERRPDLLERAALTPEDRLLLDEIRKEKAAG